jgi:hypothetical protein
MKKMVTLSFGESNMVSKNFLNGQPNGHCTWHIPYRNHFHDLHNSHAALWNGRVDLQNGHVSFAQLACGF